jgi:oligogalacturonide transporter
MDKKISTLKMKLCYGAGDIYGGGAFLIFSLLYMNFLVLVEGLPVVATSVIVFIGKIWDAVTDPMMGRISDKTRSRFGRRRIYFLIGILPVFASFIMMFYSFGMQSTLSKVIYYTFTYMFFGTAFTIVMVPYNAILSDMTSDYNERTSFTTVRMLFSGGASLIAAVVPGMLIKGAGGSVNGPAQKPGYLVMAVVMATVFGLCWLVTFLGTREKKNLPPPEKVAAREWIGLFDNKAYRNYLGIFLSFQVAVDLVLALFIFYIDIVVLKYASYELVMGMLLVFSMVFMAQGVPPIYRNADVDPDDDCVYIRRQRHAGICAVHSCGVHRGWFGRRKSFDLVDAYGRLRHRRNPDRQTTRGGIQRTDHIFAEVCKRRSSAAAWLRPAALRVRSESVQHPESDKYGFRSGGICAKHAGFRH